MMSRCSTFSLKKDNDSKGTPAVCAANAASVEAKGLTRGSREECLVAHYSRQHTGSSAASSSQHTGSSAASWLGAEAVVVGAKRGAQGLDREQEQPVAGFWSKDTLLLEIRRMYEIYEPETLEIWSWIVKEYEENDGFESWLEELRSKFCHRQFECYDDPAWESAADAVHIHVNTKKIKRFRGLRSDGTSGPNAHHPRRGLGYPSGVRT
jgi:hypothetical protein